MQNVLRESELTCRATALEWAQISRLNRVLVVERPAPRLDRTILRDRAIGRIGECLSKSRRRLSNRPYQLTTRAGLITRLAELRTAPLL